MNLLEYVKDFLGIKDAPQVAPKQRVVKDTRNWEKEIEKYGIPMVHPTYNQDEVFVLAFKNAKELRFAELDKGGDTPRYLILREAIRRDMKGKTSGYNNYKKLIVRVFERMQDELLDENSKELGDTYFSRRTSNGDYMNFEGKKAFGTINKRGEYWSPTFRAWYPHEEFIVIGRIDRLYTEWGQGTYRDGKKAGIDVGELRRQRKADGTAEALIKKHGLPVEKFLSKLTDSFKSRGKK